MAKKRFVPNAIDHDNASKVQRQLQSLVLAVWPLFLLVPKNTIYQTILGHPLLFLSRECG